VLHVIHIIKNIKIRLVTTNIHEQDKHIYIPVIYKYDHLIPFRDRKIFNKPESYELNSPIRYKHISKSPLFTEELKNWYIDESGSPKLKKNSPRFRGSPVLR
jgi:hypothetical protein